MAGLLYDSSAWTFSTLKETFQAIEEIALGELGLDVYPNQLELISSEQMLDAYSSAGMPVFYSHWSFGKRYARDEKAYRKGWTGLAYEIVINSNPCISYIMEENSMTMQAIVMAHAAFGHNHFFKNNYLFREETDAEAILDYLAFAKSYVARCEERYGLAAVERILDAAHALQDQGIDRSARRSRQTLAQDLRRAAQRKLHEEETFNDLWRTLPGARREAAPDADRPFRGGAVHLPESNLLYFLEKYSPKLHDWERELVRIVRNIAQYFQPQRQTKVMNEGCATFVHYTIMNRLFELGRISEGAVLEFLASHTAVVFQPGFDDPRYSGINPYALGFAMMQDIQRMALEPTAEDRAWFPDLAGCGDAMAALRHAWANFRDDSFILQYLSPHQMRELRLFQLHDGDGSEAYEVKAIHNEQGYRRVRRALADQYDMAARDPDIQVITADLHGDRKLVLQHRQRRGVPLAERDAAAVLAYVKTLWGYEVELEAVAEDAPAAGMRLSAA